MARIIGHFIAHIFWQFPHLFIELCVAARKTGGIGGLILKAVFATACGMPAGAIFGLLCAKVLGLSLVPCVIAVAASAFAGAASVLTLMLILPKAKDEPKKQKEEAETGH